MVEESVSEMGKKLFEIQELDNRIFALDREIEGLADKYRLGELNQQLEGSASSREEEEEKLSDLEMKQHKIDGELDLLSTKIKKEEEKLFSGTIMNPKELSSIQAEILALRKKRDEMETEDLEEMEEIDSINSEIRRLREEIERFSSLGRAGHEEYESELAEKEGQRIAIEAARDHLKGELEQETVDMYDKLLEEKGGLAVVRIDQGRNCGGCHIEFSVTQIDRFQHEEGIFRCEFCRRILVK